MFSHEAYHLVQKINFDKQFSLVEIYETSTDNTEEAEAAPEAPVNKKEDSWHWAFVFVLLLLIIVPSLGVFIFYLGHKRKDEGLFKEDK